MAKKKRKTLPADFEEIAKTGDLTALQAVFERCALDAYGGYFKGNALMFDEIDETFIRWAAAEGMDVNAEDLYGNPPLYHQRYKPQNAAVLIELGAEVEHRNGKGETLLFRTLSNLSGRTEYLRFVKLLIDHGADVHAEDDRGWTPLENALMRCENIAIPAMVDVAELLLTAGSERKASMKKAVRRIGETYEFIRPNFNREFLAEYDRALERLYALFEVEPVPRRVIYDGVSPIGVKATRWQEQFDELWDLLVPPSGNATTVQGEVIRIAGKVAREILDNGACNWSREYKKLPQALPGYLAQGNPLETHLAEEAVRLARGIGAASEKAELYRLSELIVAWVLLNPEPIAMPEQVDYKR